MPPRNLDRGFSFIELLAYMAIAALLILAAIPQFNNYRGAARDATTMSDVKNVATAMEAWRIEHAGETVPNVNWNWDSLNTDWNYAILTANGAVLSAGTHLVVRDRAEQGGETVFTTPGQEYCIFAYNPDGKKWRGASSALNYHSGNGGIDVNCQSK